MLKLEDLVSDLNSKKIEQGLHLAKRINHEYIPQKEKALVRLNDEVICSVGNFSLIIAPPGSGKSQVSEAISAGGVNPECDSMGFVVDSSKTLLVDTERVKNDLYRGYKRILSRTGLEYSKVNEKLDVFSFIEMDNAGTTKSEFEHLVAHGGYDLVIIDGIADFVKSVNDEEESKSIWRWLIKIMNQRQFGVVATIHPNPADKEGKATGHLGSQGQKKAESVFLVKKSSENKDIREITSDFDQGKVRNARDKVSSAFKWSDEENMFVSCDRPVDMRIKRIEDMFRFKDSWTHNELCSAYEAQSGKSWSTAKKHLKEAIEKQTVVRDLRGVYMLNGMEDSIDNKQLVMDSRNNRGENEGLEVQQEEEDEIVPF